ncbi:hypothetical protein AAG614_15265 [Citromicrobium bathyomarinum]
MTRTLLLSLLAIAAIAPAQAQGGAWVRQTLVVTDRGAEAGCAKARAQALAKARQHRGLNIIDCSCAPVATKADGPVAGVRCALTYEVLTERR